MTATDTVTVIVEREGRAPRHGDEKPLGGCHDVVMPYGEVARGGKNF